jgi:hypothetical protein
MVRTKHVVVLLLTAWLGGCGGYAMLDPGAGFTSADKQAAGINDATGAAAAPSGKTGGTFNSLYTPASDTTLGAPPAGTLDAASSQRPNHAVVVADAADTAVPVSPPPQAADQIAAPRGRAYLFRGVAGLIYSRGVDKLAARIRHSGIPASVDTYLLWRPVADAAIRDYRRDPQPVTLIGHSMGGDAALDFAEYLNAAHIPISLLVTYDPSRIADDVPPNVERYINIYQSSNIMGGGNVVQGSRFHGHYASYNLKDHTEIIHINIEKENRIQDQIVAKIAELAQTPAAAEGDALPIRLEVPADAAIELWDSGLAVQAHAGDTLKTLAATYRVPLWAIAEVNSVSDREPLADGQRIVVPRHLVPMPMPPSTVASYAPGGR